MKLEQVSIPGGEVRLSALHYIPESERRPITLLFAHGFSSGKYSMDSLAGYLAGRGYEGWTFDFVGHKLGGSGGEMHSALQAAENVRDILHFIRERKGSSSIVLIGHSMGGAAALQATVWDRNQTVSHPQPPLTGVICMCMGLEPARGFDSPIGQAMLNQRQDYVAGAPALQILTELNGMIRCAEQLGELPSLFIAARQDVLVSVERVQALTDLAGPRASMVVVESSHLEAPDRSRAAIIQWLDRLV